MTYVYSTSYRRLWKMMTFSSTGKAIARPALSSPLLGEDVDLEQACDHDDKRHDDNDDFGPNYYRGFLIITALQLVKIGSTYPLDESTEQVQSSKAVLLGCAFQYVLFCAASVFYKLSIKNKPAVPVPKLWVHVLFGAILLEYLMRAALLLLLQLGFAYWLDNQKIQILCSTIPNLCSSPNRGESELRSFLFVVQGSLLSICAASALYKLSLKKNLLATLVPEVWNNLVFSTALLVNVETAYQVLVAGTLFVSLAAGFSRLQSRGNSF
jgi:hypothetical protein